MAFLAKGYVVAQIARHLLRLSIRAAIRGISLVSSDGRYSRSYREPEILQNHGRNPCVNRIRLRTTVFLPFFLGCLKETTPVGHSPTLLVGCRAHESRNIYQVFAISTVRGKAPSMRSITLFRYYEAV